MTVAGGFAKLSKLAAGHLDLHSKRSQVDFQLLADLVDDDGSRPDLAARIAKANTAIHALEIANDARIDLGTLIADRALQTATQVLRGSEVAVDVVVVDRAGTVVGRA